MTKREQEQAFMQGVIYACDMVNKSFNCQCIPAYKDRRLVDPRCWKHDIEDICEGLRLSMQIEAANRFVKRLERRDDGNS